ncbi:MAG: response regulator transcription factor [Chloroflexi bacterium]|nr:response regulator transcription factor [Chloroflexota bacterium]
MREATILIVDDHPLMRTALRISLEDAPGLKVVGEAGTVAEGRQQMLLLNPDLIMLDLYLPDGSGLDLIHSRNNTLPKTRILVVSSSTNEEDIIAAVEAGADSYVFKDVSQDHLIQAVQRVLAGGSFLSPGATGILIRQLRQAMPKVKNESESLSTREKEILHHLAGGVSSTEIAGKMHITESTLRTHVQHILKKLNLQNRSQAIIYAVKNNL